MKLTLAFALGALAAASQASFELMMVADYAGRDIDRYDANTGIYLGSFGFGYIGLPMDIDVDPTTGLAYVGDGWSQSVKVFNYNTGEFVRSLSVGYSPLITVLNNGNVLGSQSGASNSWQFTPSGTVVRTHNSNIGIVSGHAQTDDGNLWWLRHSTTGLMRGTENSSTVVHAYNSPSSVPQEFLSAYGNQLLAVDIASGPSMQAARFQTSGGAVTSATYLTLGADASESSSGSAFGHGGTAYVAVSNGSTSRYFTWVSGDAYATARSLSNTQSAYGMAIVNAPEPASMIALAVGVAALMRRRSG